MNLSYETSYSNILQLSENQQQPKKQDYLSKFITNLNQTYGIPILQLQQIYSNNQHLENTNTRSTIQYQMGRELDYGDKIHINHSILKKMVEMIDKKTEFKFNSQSHRSKNQQGYRVGGELSSFSSKEEMVKEEKIVEVRRRLEEVIRYIDSQQINRTAKNQRTITEELHKIMEEPSFHQLSLQYSKDASDYNNPHNSFKASIDSHFDEHGKQATSQIIQPHPPANPHILQKQQRQYYKKSLQRISQVLSGQSISKQQSPIKTSVNRSDHNTSLNNSSIQNHEFHQNQDYMRKMILNTIANKIKKNQPEQRKSQEKIKIQEDSQQNVHRNSSNNVYKNVKKSETRLVNKMISPYTKKGLWQSSSRNTLISYESLDDLSKKQKPISKKNPFRQQRPIYQSNQNTQRIYINNQNNHLQTNTISYHINEKLPLIRQAQKQQVIKGEDNFTNRKTSIEEKTFIKQSNIVQQYQNMQPMESQNYYNHNPNIRQGQSLVYSFSQKPQFQRMPVHNQVEHQIQRPKQVQYQIHQKQHQIQSQIQRPKPVELQIANQTMRAPSMIIDPRNVGPPIRYYSEPKPQQHHIPQPQKIINQAPPQIFLRPPPIQSQNNRIFHHSQPIKRREVFTAPNVRTPKFDFRSNLPPKPQIIVNPQSRHINTIVKTIPKRSILQKSLPYGNQFLTTNYNPQNYTQKIVNSSENLHHQPLKQANIDTNTHINTTTTTNRNSLVIQSPHTLRQQQQIIRKSPYLQANISRQPQVIQAKKLDFSVVNRFQPRLDSKRLQKIAQLTQNSQVSQTPQYGSPSLSFANQNDSYFKLDASTSKRQMYELGSTRRLKKKGINLTQNSSLSQKLFKHQ